MRFVWLLLFWLRNNSAKQSAYNSATKTDMPYPKLSLHFVHPSTSIKVEVTIDHINKQHQTFSILLLISSRSAYLIEKLNMNRNEYFIHRRHKSYSSLSFFSRLVVYEVKSTLANVVNIRHAIERIGRQKHFMNAQTEVNSSQVFFMLVK